MSEERRVHYVAMAGLHGCIPQHCQVHGTYDGAVDDLAALHDLGRHRRKSLQRDGYLELNVYRDGNEYCEIRECDCQEPQVHSSEGGDVEVLDLR